MAIEDILKKVRDEKILLIRFVYIDNDGVIRSYAATAEELEGDIESGHSFSAAMPFFSVLDGLVPGTRFGACGEVSGVPDPKTFRILPFAPNSAMMICDFRNKADHSSCGLCPRTMLKDYLAGLEFDVKAAFENEFYLLNRNEDGSYEPIDNSGCFATAGMNVQHDVVLDMVRDLKAQGMQVEKYYPEYGNGQVEIVYKYDDALKTADNQVFFRETIKGRAQKHGLIASFMPKPFQHLAGSGSHLHLSLFKDGVNQFYDPSAPDNLSQTAKYFIGGLLKHLNALCAFTASTVNSYKRLVPHSWASAFSCYGFDNREAAVRVVTGLKGREASSFNIEIKPVDGACNPYLAVLTALAAGIDGIRNKIDPGEPAREDPYDMSEEKRKAMNISRLPRSLGEAADALEADSYFEEILGHIFYDEYINLKRFAWTKYIEHVSDWEIDLYTQVF